MSRSRARIGAAWTLVALLVFVAACTVVPPVTMILVELAVLALEESPLFLALTIVMVPVVFVLARHAPRQRVVMLAMLLCGIALDATPMLRAMRISGFSFNPVRALRGDRDTTTIAEDRVTYAAGDGTPLAMVRVQRMAVVPRPAVVVVYGGAWRAGSPVQAIDVTRRLARRGYFVIAVDYRHAPAHHHPAQRDDVRAALTMLRDSATAWNVDTARIAIIGRSAGGHLALLTAYSPDPVLHVRAVVAFYAPYDLEKAYADPPRPDPIDARQVMRTFIGAAPDEALAAYRDASPSTLIRPGLPPTMLVYARRDHLVQAKFGREAAAALSRAGNNVHYVEVPWSEHGFDLLADGLGSQYAFMLLEQFLEANL